MARSTIWRRLCETQMRYRFDQFDVDTDRYELRGGGRVQPVEPLVFDLIVFFARNPNRLISRDDMVEAVWRGRAVSDATISSAVKSARRALGDSGDSQSLIRTVRGRGFAFQARVETEAAKSAPSAAAGPVAHPATDGMGAR